METAAGKIIKGLTAILVGHLLFNQSVSSISCSPEAPGPKFLCLLQHMVAEACHEKLIILQGRVILFIWVRAGDRPFPGVACCASISGRGSTPTAGREELRGDLCYHLQMGGPSRAGPTTPENNQLNRRISAPTRAPPFRKLCVQIPLQGLSAV